MHVSRPFGRRYRALSRLLAISISLLTAFMLWKSLCLLSKSSSPVIVVTSESMEPAFHRGDILFVWNRDEDFGVGEVVVCWLKGRELPMVHRVIRKVPQSSKRGANRRYEFEDPELAFDVPMFCVAADLAHSVQHRYFHSRGIYLHDKGRQQQ